MEETGADSASQRTIVRHNITHDDIPLLEDLTWYMDAYDGAAACVAGAMWPLPYALWPAAACPP